MAKTDSGRLNVGTNIQSDSTQHYSGHGSDASWNAWELNNNDSSYTYSNDSYYSGTTFWVPFTLPAAKRIIGFKLSAWSSTGDSSQTMRGYFRIKISLNNGTTWSDWIGWSTTSWYDNEIAIYSYANESTWGLGSNLTSVHASGIQMRLEQYSGGPTYYDSGTTYLDFGVRYIDYPTKTCQMDADLMKVQTKTAQMDADLWKVQTKTAQMDGLIYKTMTLQAQMDAKLQKTGTIDIRMSADLMGTRTLQASMDGMMVKERLMPVSMSGLLYKERTMDASMDAWIVWTKIKTATMDANLYRKETVDISLDVDKTVPKYGIEKKITHPEVNSKDDKPKVSIDSDTIKMV